MKKRLALALAASFVFGVAGTAFAAANPFVDVPAKHWAYDSVNKLAKAGVVDGYGDGTFRGDKTMSRYEMAQIVAKAMAKSEKADAETKALVDKLAVEFASELNNLGVRVAKLEKNASNIKFEGESRLRYSWQDDVTGVLAKDADATKAFDWRQRIHMNAQVSPDIKYTARLEAVGRPGDGSAAVSFNRNFFTIDNKLGLDQIIVGKFGLYAGNYLAVGKTSNNDGIMIKEKLGTVDFTGFWTEQAANTDYKGAFLSKSFNKNFDVNVGYLAADANGALLNNNEYADPAAAKPVAKATPSLASTAWDAGVWANLGHGFNFVGEYVDTNNDGVKDNAQAWAAQVSYTTGKANAKQFFSTRDVVDKTKAHEQGFAVSYRSVEENGLPGKGAYGQFGLNKTDFGTYAQDNIKGWWAGYQNVMQKNVLLNVEYQTLKNEANGADKGDFATAYVQLFF